jgi:hypothetical protein
MFVCVRTSARCANSGAVSLRQCEFTEILMNVLLAWVQPRRLSTQSKVFATRITSGVVKPKCSANFLKFADAPKLRMPWK